MRRRLPLLNSLRTFESAARHGSFKGAAEELCVSNSAVSHQVKSLERELGVELFLRKSRAVELPRVGRAYYPILRDAFERIAEGTELVLGASGRGTITLQVYSTFTIRWLIPRLPLLRKQYPELQLRLHTSQSDVDFEHEDVDLCVMIGSRSRADLHYDYLFSSRIFPVCSPSMMNKRGLTGRPDQLTNVPSMQV